MSRPNFTAITRFLLVIGFSGLCLTGCGGGSTTQPNSSVTATTSKPISGSTSSTQKQSSSSVIISSTSSSTSNLPFVATFKWLHPTARKNGEYLELNDIGGYEIRYKPAGTDQFINVLIAGNRTLEYKLINYYNELVEIAIYDTQGQYSDFVPLAPQ